MSTIQELLRELCPNGVECKTLGETATYTRGVTFSKNDEVRDGSNGWEILRANNIDLISNRLDLSDVLQIQRTVRVKAEQCLRKGDILLCAGSGSKAHIGKAAYIGEDTAYAFGGFMAVARCKVGLNSRYLFHLLCSPLFKTHMARSMASATINNLDASIFSSFSIPLPPLPVQEEIVRRLDAMQDVVEALENELALRRKQYEAVRERLIDGAAAGAECRTLGEISHYSKERCDATSITRKQYVCVESLLQNKAGRIFAASVPQSGGLVAFKPGDILIGNIRPYLRKIWFSDCNGGTNGDVLVIVANNRKEIEPRFLFHALLSERFFIHSVSGMKEGKMPRGDKASIMKYSIPVPPLPVQEEIAKKLDVFDELVNVAMPTEIAARRRAMEVVRERCFAALEAAG